MKIERINANKIKVLINDNEAKEWNITPKKITQNTPEAQHMFRCAINMAKESVDFSIDGAKLFVETIPSQPDGIGMLITKICNDADLKAAVDNCTYKGKIHRSELRPTTDKSVKCRKYIYKFESFDEVCSAVGELKNKFFGHSALYKFNEAFYLCLVPTNAISVCECDIILCEFALRLPHSQYLHGKLNEYGTLMIKKNAVGIINEYFE